MRTSWLVCALLGTMAWGQAAPGAQTAQPPTLMERPPAPPPDTSAQVAPDAAVITIDGVCPPDSSSQSDTAAKPVTEKPQSADCKTVITKAEFEKLASGVAPSMTPQLKKQLASVLPRFIAMSEAAKKKGLDSTPQYEESLKLAKMQILTNALQRSVQEEAAKVPPEDVETYYKQNVQSFEQFSLERLFVPRSKQFESDAKDDDDDKLSDAQKKAKQEEEKEKTEKGEKAMNKLADDLRTRAAAGEDFVKLQKEAFTAAGLKIESPTVTLPKVRRTGLPAAHAAVFELKVGGVSSVINDAGGHYIYKVTAKDQLTLDQARDEIRTKLQNDRTRDMMEKVNGSYKVETNEAYFGAGGPGAAPPRGNAGVIGRTPPPQNPPATGAQPPAPSTAKPN